MPSFVGALLSLAYDRGTGSGRSIVPKDAFSLAEGRWATASTQSAFLASCTPLRTEYSVFRRYVVYSVGRRRVRFCSAWNGLCFSIRPLAVRSLLPPVAIQLVSEERETPPSPAACPAPPFSRTLAFRDVSLVRQTRKGSRRRQSGASRRQLSHWPNAGDRMKVECVSPLNHSG